MEKKEWSVIRTLLAGLRALKGARFLGGEKCYLYPRERQGQGRLRFQQTKGVKKRLLRVRTSGKGYGRLSNHREKKRKTASGTVRVRGIAVGGRIQAIIRQKSNPEADKEKTSS